MDSGTSPNRLQRLAGSLRNHLPEPAYRRCARLARAGLAWRHRKDLSRLALLYGTDKWGSHWYTEHYRHYLESLRKQPVRLLEIGVGGYDDPREGACSLRMWKAYFRRGQIVGLDLHDKSALQEPRIAIHQGDQTDAALLRRLCAHYGGFDIIIDDGSHLNEHVIQTFEILFPLLRPDGIYAVEDTQTAYWPTWGGGMDYAGNSTRYFQRLSDGLNHAEFPLADYEPTYWDRHITSVAFFHNLIIITKGDNSHASNLPKEIARQMQAGGAGR